LLIARIAWFARSVARFGTISPKTLPVKFLSWPV